MTEKRIALFRAFFSGKYKLRRKTLTEREVTIIIHGNVVIKQMNESERAAFMAALLARMLETTNKHERGRDHGS